MPARYRSRDCGPSKTSCAILHAAALPVIPGGLGITELGLIGTLVAAAGHRASAQVTAAVLLYRAVTYLPPIPLGAIACLTWRHAPALIRGAGGHPVGVIEAPV